MVGTQLRISEISLHDALKKLRDELYIVTKTRTDPTTLSIGVIMEALTGHLTRPPEGHLLG